jgi:subtilisin-like proprotein convertase family protein
MTVDSNGLNLAIPDDAYNGTKGSMICTSLEVTDNGVNFVDEVELKVGIDHPWLGDLVIKLYSPEGSVITVLSRAGFFEIADDGGGISVEGSDLEAGAPITFAMDGPYSAETLGDGNNLNNAGVACKDDGRCEYEPNSGKALPGSLSDLAGESAPGTWQVCVGDAGSADKGTFVNVALKIRKVKFMP